MSAVDRVVDQVTEALQAKLGESATGWPWDRLLQRLGQGAYEIIAASLLSNDDATQGRVRLGALADGGFEAGDWLDVLSRGAKALAEDNQTLAALAARVEGGELSQRDPFAVTRDPGCRVVQTTHAEARSRGRRRGLRSKGRSAVDLSLDVAARRSPGLVTHPRLGSNEHAGARQSTCPPGPIADDRRRGASGDPACHVL